MKYTGKTDTDLIHFPFFALSSNFPKTEFIKLLTTVLTSNPTQSSVIFTWKYELGRKKIKIQLHQDSNKYLVKLRAGYFLVIASLKFLCVPVFCLFWCLYTYNLPNCLIRALYGVFQLRCFGFTARNFPVLVHSHQSHKHCWWNQG